MTRRGSSVTTDHRFAKPAEEEKHMSHAKPAKAGSQMRHASRMAAIAAAAALTLAACGGGDTTGAADPGTGSATEPLATEGSGSDGPIVFGFSGPLTGPTAQAGNALREGAELRVKELNEAGGVLGRQVELVTCDDKSKPEEGVKCVQRLIDQDGVDAIVGTLHSPIISATAPIVGENEIPMVGAGTGVSWCNEGFQYVWRETANSDANADAIKQAIEEADWSTLGILSQNDDYGASGAESLAAIEGIEVVAEETYNPADRDFSGQIISLLDADPDVIAIWGLGDTLGPVTNQLRQQGWDGPIVGAEGYTLPEVVEVAGENVDAVIFSSLYYIPKAAADYPDEAVRTFLEAYEAEFDGLPASDNAYRSYDGATILAHAMEQAGTVEGPAVKDAINSISDLEGLAGTFDFASGGCEGIQTSRLWEFDGTSITPYQP